MSGKSTFIRTVAIKSILAQTLHICFAASYTATFFKVYSSIQISDNLLEGTSYYLQEVLAIKELVDASKNKNPCLFVLDEIFKGTNIVERISGGKAILSYLNHENNTVLVTTHDIELTALLEKEAYKLYHFSEEIESNNFFFDHKIKEGKLTTRNAIQILDLCKYPLEIITDAKAIEKTYLS
jgi:DNA mismatch repair ATPase MutS